LIEVGDEGIQSRLRQKFADSTLPRQSTFSKELKEHNIDRRKERGILKRYDNKK